MPNDGPQQKQYYCRLEKCLANLPKMTPRFIIIIIIGLLDLSTRSNFVKLHMLFGFTPIAPIRVVVISEKDGESDKEACVKIHQILKEIMLR